MRSTVRKSRRSLMDKELRPHIPEEIADEKLAEIADHVSLKEMPLEERRREANKPLFLTRYE